MAEVVRHLRDDEYGRYIPTVELLGEDMQATRLACGRYLVAQMSTGEIIDGTPLLVKHEGQLFVHYFRVTRGSALWEEET